MKLFVVSLVAACALMVALASSALASTDSHFPDGIPANGNAGATACATLMNVVPGGGNQSSTGAANQMDLFADACLGGP